MTAQEFFDKYNNRGIDFDLYYGFQCMDLAHQYAVEVVGKDFAPAPAAKDVWRQNIEGYDKIPNTPTGVPTKGDIIIWGTGVGAYGHIAVFDHGDQNSFTSFDQNWPLNSLCHYQNHNYNGVLGWFHPQKNVNEIPIVVVPLQGLAIDVGYNPTFEGQDVMVNGLHYKSIKNTDGKLVWKIETEVHNDPVVIEVPVTSTTASTTVVSTNTDPVKTETTTSTQKTTLPTTPETAQKTDESAQLENEKDPLGTFFKWLWQYIKKYFL